MNTEDTPTPLRRSLWIILDQPLLKELLIKARADKTSGDEDWVQQTSGAITEAGLFRHHEGAFILLNEWLDAQGNATVLSLHRSLDWVSYTAITQACTNGLPPDLWSQEERDHVRDDLHASLLKALEPAIREAAQLYWQTYSGDNLA